MVEPASDDDGVGEEAEQAGSGEVVGLDVGVVHAGPVEAVGLVEGDDDEGGVVGTVSVADVGDVDGGDEVVSVVPAVGLVAAVGDVGVVDAVVGDAHVAGVVVIVFVTVVVGMLGVEVRVVVTAGHVAAWLSVRSAVANVTNRITVKRTRLAFTNIRDTKARLPGNLEERYRTRRGDASDIFPCKKKIEENALPMHLRTRLRGRVDGNFFTKKNRDNVLPKHLGTRAAQTCSLRADTFLQDMSAMSQ